MARIGCLALPETGHLNPLLAVGVELARRGHDVTVFNPPDTERLVRPTALRFHAVGADRFPPGSIATRNRELSTLTGIRASLCSSRWTTRYSEAIVGDAPAAIAADAPDLLVIDQADIAAHSVAAHLGIPVVTLAFCLIMNEDAHQPVWSPEPTPEPPALTPANRRWRSVVRHLMGPYVACAQRFRTEVGLEPVPAMEGFWSSLAQVSQQPEGFDFPRRLPDCFHFAGPFCNPAARPPVAFPWARLDGRPLVYAAFGSMVNGDVERATAIADACSRLDVQLVMSFGGAAPPRALAALAGNPVVVPYAPQVELLARARAMVTHAGLNSVLECLAAGVPMVAIPITNDEPAIGARIAHAGVGVVVPSNACDPARLRAALEAVLGQRAYRDAAGRFQRAIGAGGLGRAGDIIERVLATGRAVTAARGA